jgi:Tfp pilus assembly protein PilN
LNATALSAFRGRSKAKVNKRRLQQVQVVLSISYSDLHLVIVDDSEGERRIRAHRFTWREISAAVHSEEGRRELTQGLKTLVQQERLYGATVRLSLSSDYCVTRVVVGENDEVRRELRSLEDRSALYLSLGTGENKMVTCLKPLDARNQQAWVTVANKRTLHAILEAFETAGLKIDVVEHSLVGLARAVGKLGRDRDKPVLVLEINRRGVDIGISFRGELLLDYRPGGVSTKTQIAQIVVRHLERLQRFCNRRFHFEGNQFSEIFLCGESEDVAVIREQFATQDKLEAGVLDVQELLQRCELPATNDANPSYTACIGLLVLDSATHIAPNLTADLNSRIKAPLWPSLARHAWPVAVAAGLSLAVFCGTLYQKYQTSRLERQSGQLDQSRGRLANLQLEMRMAQLKRENLTLLQQQTRRPKWHELLAVIGGSLPAGVWLERLNVDPSGAVSIVGPSQNEDAVFELVKNLKQTAALQNVALEGTQAINFNNSPAVRFDISCRLADLNEDNQHAAQVAPDRKD